MSPLDPRQPAVSAPGSRPSLFQPRALRAPTARCLAAGVALGLALMLSACGGSKDQPDCGSAGQTRELRCAP